VAVPKQGKKEGAASHQMTSGKSITKKDYSGRQRVGELAWKRKVNERKEKKKGEFY